MSPGTDEPDRLHEFFALSARAHAERVALEVPEGRDRPRTRLTYAELAERARAIERALAAHVEGECVVAILLPRHATDLYAAELAILARGAAYACLEPSHPDAHAAFVLEDSRAVLLVTDAQGAARARAARWPVPRILDVEGVRETDASALAPPAWLDGRTLAYVIYTSGTTGRPKGVLVEHRGIANLVGSDLEAFDLGPGDRVAQGSSHAYDSAVEETWLAFASGATLVVLDDESARLGPDLVTWLRAERITAFCPPPTQLRAMGCADPERALPDLRFLYVGGEALTRDLAAAWARGRWMENGYGPTECSVTVVRGRVSPEGPVTIGRAVRGNVAHVLDERLEPVAEGETGELCIAGLGLARGYLGREDLTRASFVNHARFGRLYKTGDLARRTPSGELVCLGRVDAQVKVRGHRIELGAIEVELARLPGVRAAAAGLQDPGPNAALVAFVVPADPSRPPLSADLRAALRARLPEVMVPSRFGTLDRLPTTVGGKLDRARLPRLDVAPDDAPDDANASGTTARDELERVVARAFRRALALPADPGIERDFFVDLGGDSLAAAVAVSFLREHPRAARLAVRDVYAARNVRALAEIARQEPEAGPEPATSSAARRQRARVSDTRMLAANAGMLAFLVVELLAASALAWVAAFEVGPWLVRAVSLPGFLVLVPALALAGVILWFPIAAAMLVVTKRVLIGTYRPLRAPLYSAFHVRNWIVQQVARAVPWGLVAGTEFQCIALRRLGARIGARVHLHRGVGVASGGWDLLAIGDDATVGTDGALRLVDLERGELVVGPITIGERATIDVRGGLAPDSSLGDDAWLTALSSLESGFRAGAGQTWDGVPARPSGPAPSAEHAPTALAGRDRAPLAHAAIVVLARVGAKLVFALPATIVLAVLALAHGVDGECVGRALFAGEWDQAGLAELGLAIVLSVPLTLAAQALFLRALGRVPCGSTRRLAASHARILVKTETVHAAGDWLSGTLLWPHWLRLAGMRIGRNCEVSTILDVVPEAIDIGDECFLADGIYLGGPRVSRGLVTVARTRIERGSFLGNHAVIHAGLSLPEDVLVGVCTAPDATTLHARGATFGHPPFELARPTRVAFGRETTHEPSWIRRVDRWFWELARFLLPVPPLVLAWSASSAVAAFATGEAGTAAAILALAASGTGVALASVLLVLALKWFLLGRVRPGEHPLWSCWCSRWDFHYVAWAFWARGVLTNLEGTALLAWYLRAMGASIGRRVALSNGFAHVVDPDMLRIEDGATAHALFQAHSFEDRVLKIDRITIRAGADVESGAVLFYGAEVGENARVAAHSVVMKHERLAAGKTYAGCPVRAVAER